STSASPGALRALTHPLTIAPVVLLAITLLQLTSPHFSIARASRSMPRRRSCCVASREGEMIDRPRVLCVFGTRPEAIKMAPVVRPRGARSSALEPVLGVPDQHREMLDQVLRFFGLGPDHRLGIMQTNQTPSAVAARVLERLPAVIDRVQPAALLVQG